MCVWYNNPSKPTRSERCFIDGNDTNLLRQASKLWQGFPGAAGLFLVVCDWWLGLSGVRNSKLSYLAKYFVWENITNYTSYTYIVWYCWWKNLAPVDRVNIPLFTRLWKKSQVVGNGISEPSPVSILLKRSLFYYLELLPLGFEGLVPLQVPVRHLRSRQVSRAGKERKKGSPPFLAAKRCYTPHVRDIIPAESGNCAHISKEIDHRLFIYLYIYIYVWKNCRYRYIHIIYIYIIITYIYIHTLTSIVGCHFTLVFVNKNSIHYPYYLVQ